MKENYIKSPLNYVGGKYKLLDKILPLFPDKINTFVDLFGGGFNVGVNVNAEHIIYNDASKQVCELLKYIFSISDYNELLNEIDNYINIYNLTKENQEGYLKLRDDYNNNDKSPIKFYTLLCYAFNNQIRFNRNGNYNMPFGKDRSSFNPALRQKFIEFKEKIDTMDCLFMNTTFNNFNFNDFDENDLIYCDPLYFNSVASYNENGGWTSENEKQLLNLLDILDEQGVKFALSNNFKYDNPLLKEWSKKYKVYHLNHSYNNCNYQKKDKSKDDEVLIVNY